MSHYVDGNVYLHRNIDFIKNRLKIAQRSFDRLQEAIQRTKRSLAVISFSKEAETQCALYLQKQQTQETFIEQVLSIDTLLIESRRSDRTRKS